ncbi:MAG: hypothetical protein JO290_06400 [Sphingomonadaceae bacterium]|nr:hypothetical protein [Sphingomonadaceae bacterium]
MFQIDNASAASVLPVPALAGTPGYFTGGNPATGTPPTTVSADFMNMTMVELINVVTAAGLTPSKTTYTQLTQAIRLLALAAIRSASYAVDTGAVNALAATPSLPPTALAAGLTASVLVGHTTTGAATLNWAGLGAKSITYEGGALVPGGLVAGEISLFAYDGTSWELLSGEVVPATSLPVASTTTAGIVALATAAETATGTNAAKATTPAGAAAAVQANAYNFAVAGGTANALTATLAPVPTLAAGLLVYLKASATNTGAATLALNGGSALPVTAGGSALAAGAIGAGQIYALIYDGTGFEMLSLPTSSATLGDPGWEKRPSGVVEQWGSNTSTFTGEGTVSVSFPITFPNACRNIQITARNPSSLNTRDTFLQVVSMSATGFVAYYQNNGGGSAVCDGFNWRALGD